MVRKMRCIVPGLLIMIYSRVLLRPRWIAYQSHVERYTDMLKVTFLKNKQHFLLMIVSQQTRAGWSKSRGAVQK
jgi:hypothetical protein